MLKKDEEIDKKTGASKTAVFHQVRKERFKLQQNIFLDSVKIHFGARLPGEVLASFCLETAPGLYLQGFHAQSAV